MPFDRPQRTTRRRSSAGPTPPRRPVVPAHERSTGHRQSPRPTFLTLRDHGKVYVADMPDLSDGQLSHIGKEAQEVLDSLERRIHELEQSLDQGPQDRDTLIKASTKRDVTLRFLRAIDEEKQLRSNNLPCGLQPGNPCPGPSLRSQGTVCREPPLIPCSRKRSKPAKRAKLLLPPYRHRNGRT